MRFGGLIAPGEKPRNVNYCCDRYQVGQISLDNVGLRFDLIEGEVNCILQLYWQLPLEVLIGRPRLQLS